MECEKVREIVRGYQMRLLMIDRRPRRIVDEPLTDRNYTEHLLYMCDEMLTWGDERKEKMMRWLGFIQGVLAITGGVPISFFKETNKPGESA